MDFQTGTTKKSIPKIACERLFIKGGTVVNHDQTFRADIFVENGQIKQMGTDLIVPGGVKTVDATGGLVLPGGIDVSTNFQARPFIEGASTKNVLTVDDFYTGTRAALLGGTTTVLDFSTAENGHLLPTYDARAEASSSRCCDVGFHVDVTSWNQDVAKAITTLATERDVNSFRVFLSDTWEKSDTELYEIFSLIKSLGCIALVQAENGSLIKSLTKDVNATDKALPCGILLTRNEDVEADAVSRAVTIGGSVDCPLYFWNVTSYKAIKVINEARLGGKPIYGQVMAVSLFRDGSEYHNLSWNCASSCITWPPLRDNRDAKLHLLQALSSGNLQCVSSGHCVYNNTDKLNLGKNDCHQIPPGTNGVYERMMVLWTTAVETGHIDKNEFVALTSTNAAKIFNLFPQKGHVMVGSTADLVIWKYGKANSLSPIAEGLKITQPDCSNAFEGLLCKMVPEVVICHGKIVFADSQVAVVQSLGDLISRHPFPSHIYEKIKSREKRNSKQPRASLSQISENEMTISGRNSSNGNCLPERFTRGGGHRAMHQSGWSFSGEGDSVPVSRMSKFTNPPGGQSKLSLS